MIEARGGKIVRAQFAPGEASENFPMVDLEALDRQGRTWWLHARGSWRGERPGLQRSDTVRKLLAVVYDLYPLARAQTIIQGVVTSHLPDGGTGKSMLDRAVNREVISGVFIVDLSLDQLKEAYE